MWHAGTLRTQKRINATAAHSIRANGSFSGCLSLGFSERTAELRMGFGLHRSSPFILGPPCFLVGRCMWLLAPLLGTPSGHPSPRPSSLFSDTTSLDSWSSTGINVPSVCQPFPHHYNLNCWHEAGRSHGFKLMMLNSNPDLSIFWYKVWASLESQISVFLAVLEPV